jgi:hypothetical protein
MKRVGGDGKTEGERDGEPEGKRGEERERGRGMRRSGGIFALNDVRGGAWESRWPPSLFLMLPIMVDVRGLRKSKI